jgi:MoxR-like ATPase
MKSETRSHYVFYGDMQHQSQNPHKDAPQEQEPYLAAPELVRAVNLAIYLGRPLLLEGEAGCGKTRLAHAVAYELGLPFYRWDVRSTSKAQEGLYTYDAIQRLHDAQIKHLLPAQPAASAPATSPAAQETTHASADDASTPKDPSNPQDYVRLGPLGKAFALRDCPAVVLIDEIDKADIDFPNDLLTVLDDPWKFAIHETGRTVQADANNRPIVIITSNKEKGNLPAPFLRRCIYHFIQFPEEQLRTIVETHFAKQQLPLPSATDLAISRFVALRQTGKLHKKPGTSEFLDWLSALEHFSSPASPSIQLMETEEGTYPYPELLFKLRADWQNFVEQG